MTSVLFIDDEEHLRLAAMQTFEIAGIQCSCFADAQSALGEISRDFPGIVVTDLRMPKIDGHALMRQVMEIDPEFPVILITGHGDIELAVKSIQDGAYDFLEKPYAPARLVESVRRALDKRALTLENRRLRQEIRSESDIENQLMGRSAKMVTLRQNIKAVAETDTDVLILGDTGTGKEIAAREIHRLSQRADKPFVHINSAALPEGLIESELFGHDAGAFQGAIRARYGKFEYAKGGIVCLDEIDSLAPALQAKLLNAIQNRVIFRLGSNEPIDLDIRIIAISKKDLETEVKEGHFRSDLFYRLNVATIRMPSLAEHKDDIPRLFLGLVARAASKIGKPLPEVPGAILTSLSARDWPGNVRELQNAADRYVHGLDLDISTAPPHSNEGLAEQLAEFEKSVIIATIAAHGGRLKTTYEALNISRKALYQKMQRYEIDRREFTDDE